MCFSGPGFYLRKPSYLPNYVHESVNAARVRGFLGACAEELRGYIGISKCLARSLSISCLTSPHCLSDHRQETRLKHPLTHTMDKTHINLVILSPSQEVNKLTFSGISTATSIGELREKISAEVATHPAPARQRLIYRGHALIDVGKTLKDVFTQEIVCLLPSHLLWELTMNR